ncbi:MAG: AAA family ATPase [Cyanobacteria bacterium P01_D01_bin.44]
MLKKLRLKNFKNFKDAELDLGPFTVLVGANATGKSNIRDAFRFLSAIGKGYSLPDIFGYKYTEDGRPQWSGIRGGTKEICFHGTNFFSLELTFLSSVLSREELLTYSLKIELRDSFPRVVAEELVNKTLGATIFESTTTEEDNLQIKFCDYNYPKSLTLSSNLEAGLSQYEILSRYDRRLDDCQSVMYIEETQQTLKKMSFLEFDPQVMRNTSFPGQSLGDHGENVASTLQQICFEPLKKDTLLFWLQELAPIDAKDLDFPTDLTGRILLQLVEKNGQKVSAYSASDGTLRLLGLLAALIHPEDTEFYFFEELEMGIHPSRLYILVQLIEERVNIKNFQVITTTHSPQFLQFLNSTSLQNTSVVYRLPNQTDAHIKRIMEIPHAREILEKKNIADLYSAGWLENSVLFAEPEEAEAAKAATA